MSKKDGYFSVEYELKVTECPCGSGKEPIKCCGYVKPRIHTALLDRRNYYESDGIAIGTNYSLKRIVKGELKPIIGRPIFVQSHSRKNKNPKVILRGTSDREFIMNPDSFFRCFEHVFVVDTNTRDFGEHSISMTGIVYAFFEGEALKYSPITVLEFWSADINPEILGWVAAIRAINQNGEFSDKKIGLIVDSCLGELDAFNKRKIALYEDFFLPPNMTLIYASADKGVSIANTLIKLADKLAGSQFERIIDDQQLDTLKETEYPCRYFRQWIQ